MTVSQTIIALCANGIDPTSELFTKNSKNLLDALLSFLQEDGSILHTLDGTGVTGMATEQGYQTLLAYDKFVKKNGKYNGGKTSIYYFEDKSAPEITVNGTVLAAEEGRNYNCTLAEGNNNTITLEAADTARNKAQKNITVHFIAATPLPDVNYNDQVKHPGHDLNWPKMGTNRQPWLN